MSNVHLCLFGFVRSAATTSSRTAQKMCAPVLKCHQLQGSCPLTPTGGSAPWTPAGGSAPKPPLHARAPALAIAAQPSAHPTSNYFRRSCPGRRLVVTLLYNLSTTKLMELSVSAGFDTTTETSPAQLTRRHSFQPTISAYGEN